MSHRVFIAAIVAARFLSAQASPPADDSSALLTRARANVLSSTSRLPKYTCLETIDRTYYVPSPAKHFRHPMTEVPAYSCIGIGSNFGTAGYLALDATDRLRMEVAAAGEGEIHAWPGASSFDTRSIYQMILFGPVSTGSGAIVRGRILEMRHQYSPSEFVVSIRFDTIEIKGAVSLLSVRLNHELKPESPQNQNGLKTRATEFGLPPPGVDRKGSWFVVPAGRGAYVFPAGFQSKWTTVAE